MSYLLVASRSIDKLESRVKYFCLTGRIESLDERILSVCYGKFSIQATFENLMIFALGISIQ